MNPDSDPFDHFQRYETVRRVVRQIESHRADGSAARRISVLEIGSNQHFNLGRYLPDADLVYTDLDRQEPSPGITFVQADATNLPFADKRFDYVVSLDVLEHVPAESREIFIAECARVAGYASVLACPVDNAVNRAAEVSVNTTFRRLAGYGYRWLDEHDDEGLPTIDAVTSMVAETGVPFVHFPHGESTLWQTLMRFHFLKEFAPALREPTRRLDRFYDRHLYGADSGAQCYRGFWIFGSHADHVSVAQLMDSGLDATVIKDLTATLADLARGTDALIDDHRRQEQVFTEVQRAVRETHRIEIESMRAEMAAQAAASNAELTAARQATLDTAGKLADTRQALAQEREALVRAREEHDGALAGTRKSYEASTSWRVTYPLRAIGSARLRIGRILRSALAFSRSRGGPVPAARSLVGMLRANGARATLARFGTHLAVGPSSTIVARTDYADWLEVNESAWLARAEDDLSRVQAQSTAPLISVIMPTWNSNLEFLEQAIDSVVAQRYPNWELCIADDASTNPAVIALLQRRAAGDDRIRVVARERNGHIVAATNSALAIARGAWVCFLDHDDQMHRIALLSIARTALDQPDADVIYTDEDKIDQDGQRCEPFLKPDWSPHLASSQAYIGHLVAYRRSLIDSIGVLRENTDGAQDYDLWLRASLQARRISHVPQVLYHWRLHEGSTALSADSKPYAQGAGLRALEHWVSKRYPGMGIQVVDGDAMFTYKLRFRPAEPSRASIIIPTRDKVELLRDCIESIRTKSTWQDFEILVIDNQSRERETLEYFAMITARDPRIRVVPADIDFNWSRLNNLGAAAASGDVLVFLNNDTIVISPDWLEYLIGYARLPDVGSVGGLLLFDDGTIQHSGVVVGMGGWADHVFRTMAPVHRTGPYVSPVLTRNVMAVTGACVAIEAEKFRRLGGFDESFIICGSDVELGLRAHAQGLWNVMCAESRLVHLESKSRSPVVPPSDFEQSALKYGPYRQQRTDPFFNPNLSLTSTAPTLAEIARDA